MYLLNIYLREILEETLHAKYSRDPLVDECLALKAALEKRIQADERERRKYYIIFIRLFL